MGEDARRTRLWELAHLERDQRDQDAEAGKAKRDLNLKVSIKELQGLHEDVFVDSPEVSCVCTIKGKPERRLQIGLDKQSHKPLDHVDSNKPLENCAIDDELDLQIFDQPPHEGTTAFAVATLEVANVYPNG